MLLIHPPSWYGKVTRLVAVATIAVTGAAAADGGGSCCCSCFCWTQSHSSLGAVVVLTLAAHLRTYLGSN